MHSFWWVFLAFLGGGSVGVFLMALVRVAGEAPKPSADARELSSLR